MKLTSSSFIDHGFIPIKYTCDGENISPPLFWDEVPPETVSLSLIMDDPDAPGKTFVHWVVYNIPPTINQLSENIISSQPIPGGGVQGKNDFDILGYGGPCPPSGIHRYFFHLYALDKQLNFPAGVTKHDIMVAVKNHVLAKAQLMGKYQR